MARTTKVIGFSVSPEIADAFEDVATDECRSKSELFREMFRVYQQYRAKRRAFDDQWVMDLVREAKENLMPPEQLLRESREFTAYGARRTKEMGLENLTDDDIQDIIHEHRAKQRVK